MFFYLSTFRQLELLSIDKGAGFGSLEEDLGLSEVMFMQAPPSLGDTLTEGRPTGWGAGACGVGPQQL